MVKAIFFDIDGTLRGFNQKGISDDTRHALDRARKAGIRLFIATGRHFLEVDSEDLLDGLEFDAYIPLNGQYCYEGTPGRPVIYKNPIPRSQIAILLKILEETPFPCLFMEAENWYLNFLEWCKQNDCIPDSLSFTYYDTKLISNKNHSKESFGFIYAMSLSESPDGLKDFVMQVLRERRRLNLGKLPIYLSEWNNTPSQQDLLNDTCFKSCYIVKNILENYDRLESFTYQALTDLMADSSLPNMLFFGGLGLFTVNGIPKASYYAYTLLQQLGDQFLGRGDEYFITRENDSFQVMLYNYRHFNYLYANGERFDMTETDRYTVFADSEPVMISLCLSDIPQGNYKISETYVNRTHGSAFDQWVSMGALELTTPQEIDWLKKSSVPGFHQKIVSVNSDEILEMDVTLELLEVRLIQITPLH